MRAIKPPQAWVTCILLASAAVVFIPKSRAFSSGEVITIAAFLAAEVLWFGCVAVAVAMHQNWAWRASRASREGTEQAPGTLSQQYQAADGWNIWNYGPDSPWGPWVSVPCLVLWGWLRFLAVCPDLPWLSCPGILQSLNLFMCEHWCWWQGWVMELFSFRVLESTIWVVAQPEKKL